MSKMFRGNANQQQPAATHANHTKRIGTRRHAPPKRRLRLGLEELESRVVLSANPSVLLQLAGAYAIPSYADVGFQENEVATLAASVNGQPDPTPTDFNAQINWGNGQSAGDLVYEGTNGSFADFIIKGSHTYTQASSDIPITVTVTGPGSTTASSQTSYATVSPMPSGIAGTQPSPTTHSSAPEDVRLRLSGAYSVSSYAGVGFQENEVATLAASVNGQPDTKLADFPAQINWGDSTSWNPCDLVYEGTNGSFADYLIKGSHTYDQTYSNLPIVVFVNGPDGTSVSNLTSYATVSPMPSGIAGTQPSPTAHSSAPEDVRLQLSGAYSVSSYAGVGFQENEVATLAASINGQPDTKLADFPAQINWGDGASWNPCDLVYEGTNGSFADYLIKGSHTYDQTYSNLPIVVFVNGPDGTSVSNLTSYATVSPMPSGIAGTQPSPTAHSSAPEDVRLQLSGAYSVSSYAGVGFQENEVATLAASINGQPDTKLADFPAQINWGDSASWNQGDLVYEGTNGSFADYYIRGSHIYNQAASNIPIVVFVNGPDGTSVSDQAAYANVRPNPYGMNLGNLSETQWDEQEPGYDGTIEVSGGSGGYQNLQVTGLPAGLNASVQGTSGTVNGITVQSGTITLSGTPSQSGTFMLQVTVQDGNGGHVSGMYTLNIDSALSVGSLSPAQWDINKSGYNGMIAVSGGSGSLNSASVSGLPAGLSEMTAGSNIDIVGTPTVSGTFPLQVFAKDTNGATANGSEMLTINPAAVGPPQSTVADRFLFYSRSAYDKTTTALPFTPLGFSDDNAIATDKSAYLPGPGAGSPATFASVSSYSLGINGVMVDLSPGGSHSSINISDFVFKSGNTASVDGTWTTLSGANLPTVSVRLGMTGSAQGAGTTSGSDRVELIWASGTAVTQKWLEVDVKAGAHTGLVADDHFFFGSEIGDANKSNLTTIFKVTATDTTSTQTHVSPVGNNNPITNVFDYNRDGAVGSGDITIDQTHGTTNSTGLVNITIAAGGPFAPPPPSGSGTDTSGAALASSGNAAVASSLAAPTAGPTTPAVPKWLVNRLSHLDLNGGRIATFFEHLAQEDTTKSWAMLVRADQIADALGLDDELLDGLLVGLGLE